MVRTVMLCAGADLAHALAVEFVEGLAQGYRFHYCKFYFIGRMEEGDKTSRE